MWTREGFCQCQELTLVFPGKKTGSVPSGLKVAGRSSSDRGRSTDTCWPVTEYSSVKNNETHHKLQKLFVLFTVTSPRFLAVIQA